MNGLALCAGSGALELGLRLALGPGYRLVGAVERDAYAAAVLVARMADETLEKAPVWDDVATFDGRPWRDVVDLVSAGFSCQPWSDAGQKLGTDDERWLWPDICRVVREVGPPLVFLENVPALATRGGLGHVLADLAEAGFDAEWGVLSAGTLGASHERPRVFILAYAHERRQQIVRWLQPSLGPRSDARGRSGPTVGNADSPGRERRTQRSHEGGVDLADQAKAFLSGRHCETTAPDGSGSSAPAVLNPLFDEWLMGWPLGWTESTASATESYRSWLQQHSSALHDALDSP